MFGDKKAKKYTIKKFGGCKGFFEQQDGHLKVIIVNMDISSVTEGANP